MPQMTTNIIWIQLGSKKLWPWFTFLLCTRWPWPLGYDLGVKIMTALGHVQEVFAFTGNNMASCKWRDAQRAMRNFSPLKIYRLYGIGLTWTSALVCLRSILTYWHCLGAGERRYGEGAKRHSVEQSNLWILVELRLCQTKLITLWL